MKVMSVAAVLAVAMSGATLAYGIALAQSPAPIIDNERVTVWDTTTPLPPAAHDFVAV